MRKILVTGGTVFVSKFVAEYYAKKENEVYVLNRNTRQQPENTRLIEADRHHLEEKLKAYDFDAVLDINAYTKEDIKTLCDALGNYQNYIMISSSAVYPETLAQPFREDMPLGVNAFWGAYGTDKIAAEEELLKRVPDAYILRPPYLYGPMNNVYREAFVFDCAMENRPFYVPKDGSMPLQFFHVEDLCRVIDCILEKKPETHIFNVGNEECVTIEEWVRLCYEVVGKACEIVRVEEDINPRAYFCFHDYAYKLAIANQKGLLTETKPLVKGLQEAYEWYCKNKDEVMKRPYKEYIDGNL